MVTNIVIGNPEGPANNRKHMYFYKLNKQIKTRQQPCPSPVFLQLIHLLFSTRSLSFSWESPGQAWPERHLLHNVTG